MVSKLPVGIYEQFGGMRPKREAQQVGNLLPKASAKRSRVLPNNNASTARRSEIMESIKYIDRIQILDLIQNLIVNEINDIIDDVFTVELPNALIQYESIDASPVRFGYNSQNNIVSSPPSYIISSIPNSQGKPKQDVFGGTINTNNFTIDENKDTLFLFEDLKHDFGKGIRNIKYFSNDFNKKKEVIEQILGIDSSKPISNEEDVIEQQIGIIQSNIITHENIVFPENYSNMNFNDKINKLKEPKNNELVNKLDKIIEQLKINNIKFVQFDQGDTYKYLNAPTSSNLNNISSFIKLGNLPNLVDGAGADSFNPIVDFNSSNNFDYNNIYKRILPEGIKEIRYNNGYNVNASEGFIINGIEFNKGITVDNLLISMLIVLGKIIISDKKFEDWGDEKNKTEIVKIVELVNKIYKNKDIDEKIRFLALLKFIGDRGQILTVQEYNNSDSIKNSNTKRAILASSDRIFIAHTLNIKQPIIFSRSGNINVYTPNNYNIEKSKTATNDFIKENLSVPILKDIKKELFNEYKEEDYKLNYDENQEILKNIIIKNINMNDKISEFFVRYVENINIENIENINRDNIEGIIQKFISTLRENLRNNNPEILKSIRIKNMFKNIQKKLLEKIRQIAAFRRRKRMPMNAQKEMKILEFEQGLLEEIKIESQEIDDFESQEIDYDSIIGEFNKEQSEQKKFKTNNMNFIKKKEIIKNHVSELFNEKYKNNEDICFIDSTFDTNYEEINKKLLSPDKNDDDSDDEDVFVPPKKSGERRVIPNNSDDDDM
tara:strand:- start:182 stop:2509 length:2328 start_codon:yes stop_codon:yes gene_type:complete